MNMELPKFPVNLALFNIKAHNPSFYELNASLADAQRAANMAKGAGLRDFCVPVNPYFPTPQIQVEMMERMPESLKYYPPGNEAVAKVLGRTLALDPETLVLGNGSTELITWIDRLFVKENLITSVPTFGRWTDQPKETGKEVFYYRRCAAQDYAIDVDQFVAKVAETGSRVAVISNPNNPTGAVTSVRDLKQLAERLSHLDLIVIDESFIEFSAVEEVPTFEHLAAKYPNVMVLKSLGKNFGQHGVRLGYCVANKSLAADLRNALPKWNINGVGVLLVEMYSKYHREYELGRRAAVQDRIEFELALRQVTDLVVYPSSGNFVYVQAPFNVCGIALRNALLQDYGIFIRECGNKIGATSNHFRIAVRPKKDAEDLVVALRETLRKLYVNVIDAH